MVISARDEIECEYKILKAQIPTACCRKNIILTMLIGEFL